MRARSHLLAGLTAPFLALAAVVSVLAAPTQADSAPPSLSVAGTVSYLGRPQAGATVTIAAWPDQRITAHIRPGHDVPLVPLGSAVTAPDGRYQIRIPDGLLAPEADGGVVNLEADSGGGTAFFPVTIGRMPGNASVAAVAHPATANIAALTPSLAPAHCGVAFDRTLGKHWTRVGQTYVATSGVRQTFSYSSGQSSTLGIALENNVRGAAWHESGTASWTSSSGVGYPVSHRGNEWYNTLFRYGEYEKVCTNCHPGRPNPNICSWFTRVNGFAAGALTTHPRTAPRTPGRFCSFFESGSEFFRDYSRAVTWSAGFSLFGVGLEAQTGYDVEGHVHFWFGSGRNLCGTNNDPPLAAQLVAR
jgi:hypothetical protein